MRGKSKLAIVLATLCITATGITATAFGAELPRDLKIYLVRHGETEWNREGRLQGQGDVPLNESGMKQADQTAARFRGVALAAVMSSPLSRARVTGQKICDAAGCENFITDDAFMEIDVGDMHGLTPKEMKERFPDTVKRWGSKPHLVTLPGGESLEDVRKRAVAALERITFRYKGHVLLVTHDTVVKTLICHYLDVPLANYWRFKIPNCSVSCLEFAAQGARLVLLGDVCHLTE